MNKLFAFLALLVVSLCTCVVHAGEDRSVQPTGKLPIIYINCDVEVNGYKIDDYNLPDKDYRTGAKWWLVDPNNEGNNLGSAEAPLTLDIKARGNYTRTGFTKKPFKLKLGSKLEPLGLSKSKHFALLNHPDDEDGFMRNFVGFWLGREMAKEAETGRCMWAPTEVPVELVLNGQYWGLYFLTESIRVEESRINITELKDNISDPALITGGYLIELDNYSDEGQIVIEDYDSNLRAQVTPDTPEVYSPIQKQFVTDQFTNMKELVKSKSDDLWSYMDLDAAARYYLVMEAVGHYEAYHGSTYMYRDRGEGKKWIFSPVWDFGHAFDKGHVGCFLYQGFTYGNTWIEYMWGNENFKQKVKDTWVWFMNNNKKEALDKALDNYKTLIADAAVNDHKRWGDIKPNMYQDPLNNYTNTNPTAVCNNTDMDARLASVKSFLDRKFSWLNGEWGTPSDDKQKPALDTTEPAALPPLYTVYYRHEGSSVEPTIYIWYSTPGVTEITPDGWNGQPKMTKGTATDGKDYWYYSFFASDADMNSRNPKFIVCENGSKVFGENDIPLTSGTLYLADGTKTPNWDPKAEVDPIDPIDPPTDPTYEVYDNRIDPTEDLNVQPTGKLPVLYINGPKEITNYNLRDKDYRDAVYYMVDPNNAANNLGSADEPLPLEIKARGNYTRTGFSKKPFKLKLGKKKAPLGLSESKHFALLAHADDKDGYMRNYVGFWLGREIDAAGEPERCMWSPTEVPVEVVLNGQYWGLYFLTESIRVEESRINITELKDNISDPALISGGYLIELDNYAEEGQIVIEDSNPSLRAQVTPDTPEVYSPLQRAFVTQQFTTMKNCVASASDSDDLWKYMDLDAAARYYLVMEAVGHWEAYHGSTYMYRDRGDKQKWVFSPVWDFGNAFAPGYDSKYLYQDSQFGNTWIEYMWGNEKFKQKVKDTWKWFMNGKKKELFDDLEAYATLIDAAAKNDHKRWGKAKPDQYQDPMNNYQNTNPTEIADNSDMSGRLSSVESWLTSKFGWLNGQWGTPTTDAQKPAIDTTPAAPLPSIEELEEMIEHENETVRTIYYRNPGSDVTPRIYIWYSENGQNVEPAGNWTNRASMREGTDAAGVKYFYYSLELTAGQMASAQFIITENGDSKTFDNTRFENKTLFVVGGDNISDWDPEKAEAPVEPDKVILYLYDDAEWGAPIYAYVYDDSSGSAVNNHAWPGVQMTALPVGTELYGIVSTATKQLYTYEVPEHLVHGVAIFYHSNDKRWPGDNERGITFHDSSEIYNNKTHEHENFFTFSGTLPVLLIETADNAAVPDDKTKIDATFSIDNAHSGANWAVNPAPKGTKLKIQRHGSTSWTDFDKKPYKLKFTEKQVFGDMPTSKHFLLLPYTSDAELGFMRNIAGHELSKAIGMSWTPGQEPVELMLNGHYMGLYFLVENIRPAGERIKQWDMSDITEADAPDTWLNWIVELDNSMTDDEAFFTATDPLGHTVRYDLQAIDLDEDLAVTSKRDKYAADLTEQLTRFISNVEYAKNNDLGADGWDATFDAEECARYVVLQELMDDPTAFSTAFYMTMTSHDDKGNLITENPKWQFGPVWDFSNAFANGGMKSGIFNAKDSNESLPIVSALYHNHDFYARVIREYIKFVGGYDPWALGGGEAARAPMRADAFSTPYDQALENITAKGAAFESAIHADAQRWADQYAAITPATMAAYAADATEHQNSVETVKSYLNNTADFLTEGPYSYDILTGLQTVTSAQSDAPVEYFDLLGRRISRPAPGTICIRRQGTRVVKEIIR